MKNFTELARLLNRLIRNVEWRWSESKQLSFNIIRIKCATQAAMYRADFLLVFHFYSDVSGFRAELVITQFHSENEHLILYDTFSLNNTERRYPTYKRELCKLVRFATKYDYFLRNPSIPGIIHTDHKLLVRFLDSDLHDDIYEY